MSLSSLMIRLTLAKGKETVPNCLSGLTSSGVWDIFKKRKEKQKVTVVRVFFFTKFSGLFNWTSALIGIGTLVKNYSRASPTFYTMRSRKRYYTISPY
jgi:hypothetical protein